MHRLALIICSRHRNACLEALQEVSWASQKGFMGQYFCAVFVRPDFMGVMVTSTQNEFKSYQSKTKQNNSMELFGYSLNHISCQNDPPDPLDPKSAIFSGFSGIFYRTSFVFFFGLQERMPCSLDAGELGGPQRGCMGQYFSASFLIGQWFSTPLHPQSVAHGCSSSFIARCRGGNRKSQHFWHLFAFFG